VNTIELWTGERWSRVLRIDPTPPTAGRAASSLAARQARYRGKPIPKLVSDLEIQFRNGERVSCTPNHKWPTQRGEIRADELLVGDVVPTGTLPDEPESEPAGLADEDTGWFVGMYLAEGSRSGGTIQMAGHVKEVDRNKRLAYVAAAYHGTCRVHHTGGNTMTANITGPVLHAILDTYISGRVAKDKRLSPKCWQRSNRFLDALLRGYLEGDGHRRTDTEEWRLGFTANDGLASDLRTIGARLGLSVHLSRKAATLGERSFPGWRGSIRTAASRRMPDGQVVAVRQSRARQFWNIEIADEPHLFSLASGVLTRNSNAMPESVTDRLSTRYEMLFLLSKSRRYWFDLDPIREAHSEDASRRRALYGMNMSDKRYAPKDRKDAERQTSMGVGGQSENPLGRNPGDVWTIPTVPFPGAHFATYPPELVRRCIVSGCKPGGTVLDPFHGSGTTGMVAVRNGRKYVGIELNQEYLDLSLRTRLADGVLNFEGESA
jgi:hypothetical protein